MERYEILGELGDGTCGSVYKALNKETCETVAVKKMKRKFYYWEECMNLREVKALRKLNHPNIVKLKEVVRENNELFFIFEYMWQHLTLASDKTSPLPEILSSDDQQYEECNLYQLMRERQKPFSEEEICNFVSQLVQGLAHMHKVGYFHRDLKPENLLVTDDVLKIADFGLSREVASTPPYTEYVSTRWYRAPEVLLQSSSYTPAIDMWAVGAILAELFTLSPIFPGESETDQLHKICCVLGVPNYSPFSEGTSIFPFIDINSTEILPANLSAMIPNASSEAIDLIMQLCSWDPLKRPTAEQSLQHPFFNVSKRVPFPLRDPYERKLDKMDAIPNLELNLWNFGNQPDDCFLGLTLAVRPSNENLDLMRNVSQGIAKDIFFGSDCKDCAEPSVYWSLLSPNENQIQTPVDSSLSLSFSSIRHQSVGGPQSTGLTLSSLQPGILDCPLMAMPSSFQQGHWL